MQIDLNASVQGKTNTPASLSPELDQLLSALKLQIGQKADANVSRIILLTESEKQQLLAARTADKPSAGQKALLAVLRDPNVKLAELTIREQSVSTLTNLPLTRNSRIEVLATPRGLVLLPPTPAQPSSTPTVTANALLAPKPGGLPLSQPTPTVSLPIQAAGEAPQNALPRSAASATVAINPGSGHGLTTHARPPPGSTPASGTASPSVQSGSTTTEILKPTDAEVRAQPRPTVAPVPKSLLATAISQTLPIAQPLKNLLNTADATTKVITNTPPATASSVPIPVTELRSLLGRISQHALDVTNVKPDLLRQAMNNSGLFYERRMVAEYLPGRERDAAASPLSERDLKGLLIQLTQWAAGQTAIPPTAGGQASSDTLAQLMMSLARLWTPRQTPTKGDVTPRQLSQAVQEMAEKSLAQIQLQQFRTLSSQLPDSSAPAQWHMDIPLKLPDAYGNLYLQLFEQRLTQEEKKSGRKNKSRKNASGRWRVFLELELDDMGSLAAEISVQDKNVEATLWSGNHELRQRVHAQLENLRGDLQRQGIEVTDLRCSANPPPEQKIRLDYALVDVKT